MKRKIEARLLKIARHLGNCHLKELLMNNSRGYAASKGDNRIECFYWALQEFPKIFSEWDQEHGVPYLAGKRDMNSITAAGYYLDLDMDSLFHLLVSGYQMPEVYNGKQLGPNATPSDLASNIYEFLRSFEEVEMKGVQSDNTTKTILLTPTKTKNHERNKTKLPSLCA